MNKDIFSNHPIKYTYLEFIQQRISELGNLDLKAVSIDYLKFILLNLCRAHISAVLTISEGESIFRATKHTEQERDKFFGLGRIYPDPKFINRLGRANREHQPTYYFAAEKEIALHEVKAVKGDIVTILECKPRRHAKALLIPVGIHDMLRKHNIKIGGNLPEPALRIQAALKDDVESCRKNEIIDRFIIKEFLRDVPDGQEYKYKLSIAIAEYLFGYYCDEGPQIDGITYPSIATDKINANVAFQEHAFHRIYEPVACQRLEIEETIPNRDLSVKASGFTVSSGRVAESIGINGKIIW